MGPYSSMQVEILWARVLAVSSRISIVAIRKHGGSCTKDDLNYRALFLPYHTHLKYHTWPVCLSAGSLFSPVPNLSGGSAFEIFILSQAETHLKCNKISKLKHPSLLPESLGIRYCTRF